MEVTIKDLNTLKLSPTLIIFLKTIYNNDNEYLTHLSFNVDIWQVAKHLEKLMVIKIVGDTRECKSFEIRKLSLLEYLGYKDVGLEKDIDEVINYLNLKSKKNFRLNTSSNRKLIRGRFNEGYNLDDFKRVIDILTEDWIGTSMDDYLRPETLFNATKFQGYVNRKRSTKSEINKMI